MVHSIVLRLPIWKSAVEKPYKSETGQDVLIVRVLVSVFLSECRPVMFKPGFFERR